ncbi:hypothetical protein Zmor_004746 [Zophobas morio]|uniref:Uncharacterized protein n=1 Tax=Zophobas morio TaxID=2755281 RepID=A0AA38MKX2_9CUCU|nr:hypothetical protein Zmor_004746 [Zophobas morio]
MWYRQRYFPKWALRGLPDDELPESVSSCLFSPLVHVDLNPCHHMARTHKPGTSALYGPSPHSAHAPEFEYRSLFIFYLKFYGATIKFTAPFHSKTLKFPL